MALLESSPPDGAAASPPVLERPRHNLPAPLTPFVGRDAECARLLDRLHDPSCRLVTITGVGGVGKTRLALETAALLIRGGERPSPFLHGVYFVPLADIAAREPLDDTLAAGIASALDLSPSGPDSVPTQVRNYLREKAILLLLDNFDHLLAGAGFLSTLLQEAPELKLLITSREMLRIWGEWVVELDGLACSPLDQPAAMHTPDEYGAIDLFVRTARACAPDLALTAETMPVVAQVCRLVGGLPLGIELAASWTRFLSCAEIAAEIARSMDFLNFGARNLPARQQSMRAVFASSWSLLTTAEQQALRRLAVFRGSFTRTAAATVAATPLPLLASLMNKSLVRRVAAGDGAEVRYEVPEPLRQYAAEELERAGEADNLAAGHAAYYLALLEARTADLRGPRQPQALADLSAEIAHIRAAWHWAVAQGESERLGRAANGLFHLYDMRSWFAEGAAAFGAARQALSAQASDTARPVWGKLLAREGWFTFHTGRQREARELLEQSLTAMRACDAAADLIWTLNYLAVVCSYLGDYRTTEMLCHESLELAERAGDVYGRVIALSVLCQTAYEQGDYAAAKTWGEQSQALEQQIGSPWSIAYSLLNLGKVAAALGEYAAARQLFDQSLQIRQELGDLRGVAICLNRLGDTARALGAAAEAAGRYAESLALFHEIGNQWGSAAALLNLGRLALDHQADAAAARLLHAALELALDTSSAPQVAAIVSTFAQLVERARERGWAAVLAQLAASEPGALDRSQVHITRLLGWSKAGGPAETMSLEQAIAVACAAPTQARTAAPMALQPPANGPTYPAGLTAREVEVLRLVAQGLTDAQVAERLVVSRRTVHAHLASIYGKIQVNSRSAATRFAVEQSLL